MFFEEDGTGSGSGTPTSSTGTSTVGDWTSFKKGFKSKLDKKIDKISLQIGELESECEVFQNIIDNPPPDDPSAVRLALQNLTNQLKMIRGLRSSLAKVELAKLVEARTAFDKLTKEELEAKGGPLDTATKEEALATAELQDAQLTVIAKEMMLGTAEDDLAEHLAKYDDLKLLLAKMNEAEDDLKEKDAELSEADDDLKGARERLARADLAMIALSKGTTDLSEASTIVEEFTAASGALGEARATRREAAAAQREAKKTLEAAADALDLAIEKKLKAVSPTSRLSKDNKLLELYVEVKAARLALAQAQEAQEEKSEKAQNKSLNLERVKQRQELLTKRAALYEDGFALRTQLVTPPLSTVIVWKGSVNDLKSRLSEERFKTIAEKAYRVMMRLEELIKLGMTPDEVEEFYTDLEWPDNWRPPFMRAQEQNWVAVKELIQSEDIERHEKQQKDELSVLMTVVENQETVMENFAEALETAGVIEDKTSENLDKYLTLFSSIIVLGREGVKAAQAVSSKDHDSVDPVEQMMIIDETIGAIGKTGSAFLKTAASALDKSGLQTLAPLVPGIGAVDAFGNMCANAMIATNTWVAAIADAEVHQKALLEQHRAEGATDFVQKRGKHLGARRTTDAVSDLLAFCGHVCDLAGVTAPVGVALGVASSAVKAVATVSAFVIDTTHAQEARDLLTRAQAGDPEAREDIFRHHGRYACALIAILAEEGDPIALAIYNNHSITKEMVIKSSAKVLKKYLMKEMETVDEPDTWDSWKTWFTDTGKGILGFFKSAGNAVSDLKTRVAPFFDPSPSTAKLAKADLAVLKMGMDSVGYVKRGVEDLLELRKTYKRKKAEYERIPSTETTKREEAAAALKEYTDRLKEFDKVLDQCQTKAETALKDAAALIGLLKKPRSQGGPTPEFLQTDIGKGSERRFRELIDEQRRVLTVLAQAR